MIKTCNKCREEKETSMFYFDSVSKRYRSNCKQCEKEKRDSNPEIHREINKKNYLKNIEKRKQAISDYYQKTKEERKQYHKNHYSNNKVIYYEKAKKRQLLIKKRIPKWDSELCDFVFREAYLLAKLREKATSIKWHVDHIIPLQGKIVSGLHVWNNFQVIPAVQNLSKSNFFKE